MRPPSSWGAVGTDDVVALATGAVGALVAVVTTALAIWTAVTNRHDRRLERLRPKPADPTTTAYEETIKGLRDALYNCRRQREYWQAQALAERKRADDRDARLDAANYDRAKAGLPAV